MARDEKVVPFLFENLEEVLQKQITGMALTYDIEKDSLYQKGLLKGKQEGMEEGLQEGMEKGELQKALKFARKCLEKGMRPQETAELTELPLEKIEVLAKG